MTSPPSDGLGDGTTTTEPDVTLDVTTLTQQEANDYRHELILAICHPGTDYDMTGPQFELDQDAYKDQLRRVEDYLKTFDQY
jgi:hypothetical protein